MKNCLLFICMLMACLPARAQNDRDYYRVPDAPNLDKTFGIRLNPTGILDDFDRNISFGGEYFYRARWSTGLDAAYIFESKYFAENKKTQGMILRPFIRFYLNEDYSAYLDGNVHFKNVNYLITDWLGKEVVNGVPAYEEYSTFKYSKTVIGLDLKIGRNFSISQDHRLWLELYLGIGYRLKEQGAKGGSFFRNRDVYFSLHEPSYSYASVPAGFRLTYRLK